MKRNYAGFNETAFNEAVLITESLDQILSLILDNQSPEDNHLVSQIFGAIKLSEAIKISLKKVEESIFIN